MSTALGKVQALKSGVHYFRARPGDDDRKLLTIRIGLQSRVRRVDSDLSLQFLESIRTQGCMGEVGLAVQWQRGQSGSD